MKISFLRNYLALSAVEGLFGNFASTALSTNKKTSHEESSFMACSVNQN